jgi:molybdate transport system regulatory protein
MRQKEDEFYISGRLRLDKSDRAFLGGDRIELLEKIQALGSIAKAAKAVGISYKTAWEIVDAMNNLAERPLVVRMTGGRGGGGTHLTPEGNKIVTSFKVIQEEHKTFLDNLALKVDDIEDFYSFLRSLSLKVSARNIFKGKVIRVITGAVNAEVELQLPCGDSIIAMVTNESVEHLELKRGRDVYALIKASSVILGRDLQGSRLSASNILCGTVAVIVPGAVNTDVSVCLPGENTISAIITNESARYLSLTEGDSVSAVFQASSVILGVE